MTSCLVWTTTIALVCLPVWSFGAQAAGQAATETTTQAPAHDHAAMLAAAADAEIATLLADMDKAKGSKKVDIMASLVRKLVAARRSAPATAGPQGADHGGHGAMCPMCAAHMAQKHGATPAAATDGAADAAHGDHGGGGGGGAAGAPPAMSCAMAAGHK